MTIGEPHPPCPECVDAMRQHLRDASARERALAETLHRNPATRRNANVARRMAAAYGWAAGELRGLLR